MHTLLAIKKKEQQRKCLDFRSFVLCPTVYTEKWKIIDYGGKKHVVV